MGQYRIARTLRRTGATESHLTDDLLLNRQCILELIHDPDVSASLALGPYRRVVGLRHSSLQRVFDTRPVAGTDII